MDSRVNVIFELEQDENGYPPVASESLWAKDNGDGTLTLENIPFFAEGVSDGDVIIAQEVSPGKFVYLKTILPSGNSTIRVVFEGDELQQDLKVQLRSLGCEVEESSVIHPMYAVSVPQHVDYLLIEGILDRGVAQAHWEWEEACLRR